MARGAVIVQRSAERIAELERENARLKALSAIASGDYDMVGCHTSAWQPENTGELAHAIKRVERELPGWWWSVGACHVSSDATVTTGRASVGPDMRGPLNWIVDDPVCDAGFHNDLRQPSSCAEALNGAIDMALAYLKEKNLTPTGT